MINWLSGRASYILSLLYICYNLERKPNLDCSIYRSIPLDAFTFKFKCHFHVTQREREREREAGGGGRSGRTGRGNVYGGNNCSYHWWFRLAGTVALGMKAMERTVYRVPRNSMKEPHYKYIKQPTKFKVLWPEVTSFKNKKCAVHFTVLIPSTQPGAWPGHTSARSMPSIWLGNDSLGQHPTTWALLLPTKDGG